VADKESEADSCLDPAFDFDCNYIEFDIDYKIAAGTDMDRLAKSTLRLLKEGAKVRKIEKFKREIIILSSVKLKISFLYSLVGFCLGGRVTSGEILTSSGDGSRFMPAS
jgi:hypothetical protein